ncbi:MAG TPA: hypothetical protein PLM09_00505 [Casimicrobiaceae bacterium]|nr:hypothetical protein [Casimicrobiaceae bacterium]
MRPRIAAVLGAILLASVPALAQNLVVNGSFENPAYSAGANYPVAVTGWSITPDSGFEVWNNFQGPGADGSQYLELDVYTCNTISQAVPTIPGHVYDVRYAFGGRPGVADNQVVVRWNGTQISSASADGTGQTAVIWTYYNAVATATSSSSTLTFTNVDACDALGAMLDDVSVVDRGAPIATVVPTLDPRLLAALAAALAMAALVLLRRAR